MNKTLLKNLLGVLCATLVSGTALAGVADDVVQLRQSWERIKYRTPEKEQESAFELLAKDAARLRDQNPKDAGAAVWFGIIESSHAGAKGGLGALSLAKNAKKAFEDAIAIEPKTFDGSAYTSLGSLYYQVPGWPIGFGDDKLALEMLQKGLALNPDGIDSNYFYADFLYRKGDFDAAERTLKKALMALPREGRAIADEGRRKEIQVLLEKIAHRRK